MKVIPTRLEGCFIVAPQVLRDARGYFTESFNLQKFKAATGLEPQFIQDNQSYSSRGVLRGLHYQVGDWAQTKLVRVVYGEVLDVVVDIRPESPTYGQHEAVLLNDSNMHQLYVPKGFAHGYAVLSKTAIFFYKCDQYYHQSSEAGIKYDDPALGIDWGLQAHEAIVSEKDMQQPLLAQARPIW